MHKAVKRYAMSNAHLQPVLIEKVFGNTIIQHAVDQHLEIGHWLHNNLVDNEKIFKNIINVVCFLRLHELGFTSHN